MTCNACLVAHLSGRPWLADTVIHGRNGCVTANAVPEPTYRWRFNQSPLAGATNTSLTLTNATTNQSGFYTVVITRSAALVAL